MRKLRRLSTAALMTLSLSASIYAGEIWIPGPPPPPPEPSSNAVTGGVETPGGASAASQADYSATNVAFDLLQAVLTVF